RRTRGGERHSGGNNMKALTRTLALLGCAAALGAALAACDQELRDSGNRVAIQGGGSDSTASWTGTVTGGGWWEKFAGNDEKVDAGTTMRATMTITSVGTKVHETPIIILRNSAAATKNKPDATADDGSVEYAVLRSDAYGWNADGNTNDDLEKLGWTKDTDCTFDADWLKWLKGSTLVVTVKNYGTGKADVLLDFSKDGKTQYVHYKNITVDADELYFNLTFENCNVTFGEAPSDGEDEEDPTLIESISIKTKPTVKTGITYGKPNLSGLVITVNYNNNSAPAEVKYSDHPGDFSTDPEKFTDSGNVTVKVKYLGFTTPTGYDVDVKKVTEAAAAAYALDGNDSGVRIEGSGNYVEDNTFGAQKVFKNNPDTTEWTGLRSSYLVLPSDTLQHSAQSKEMTIGFWVSNSTLDNNMFYPIFTAYKEKTTTSDSLALSDGKSGTGLVNTWPCFILQSRGLAQINCAGWSNLENSQNDTGKNAESIAWLGAQNTWHYYTCVITETTLKVYADGKILNSWTVKNDGTDGEVIGGIFESKELTYVCLGGNQAWNFADFDAPYSFAKFSVWDVALNEDQINSVMTEK
ncbi:MAG: hypothetical protein J1D88_03915, partial [Treponema sp.]|nr:hypothetical protein [Treponema sp.]